MKKVFSIALVLVALLGIAQITPAPAYADDCEDFCYKFNEACLQLGNPQTCANLLARCLEECAS